jgi:hypothetical protein
MLLARMKNPLCRMGHLSLSVQMDAVNWSQADDDYCHAHLDYLRQATERLEKQWQDRHRIAEFTDFVSREDFATLPAIGAICASGSHADTAEFLGIMDAEFTRMRTRLRQLCGCFENRQTVPRQRNPYKKRVKTLIDANILGA